MTRILNTLAFLLAGVCAQSLYAQDNTGATPQAATTAPVAYVYVSTTTSGGSNQVRGYAAASNGRLTTLKGSPFAANVVSMALTGTWLFGTDTNGTDIDSFSIASDGTLKKVTSINAAAAIGTSCPGIGPLVLDHTGATLYVAASAGGDCSSSEYASFKIDKSNGALSFLGSTSQSFLFNTPLSFLANNQFAYGTDCVNFQGNYTDTFAGVRRESTGMINYANVSLPAPKTKVSGQFYCRNLTAADPNGHLAVSMQAIDPAGAGPVGAPQLGVYTADSSGNLTTTSTFANMPASKVMTIASLAMSPSGKLLAVSGAEGLEVFHFNGSSPITRYTGLLNNHNFLPNTPSPGMMFWDNSNHLYIISPSADQALRVFTITPTSATLAAGSPMPVSGVQNIAVLPK